MFDEINSKGSQKHDEFIEEIHQQISDENEVEVPSWNRASAFEQVHHQTESQYEKLPWWRWQNIGGVALACSLSIVALLSVYTNKSEQLDATTLTRLVKAQVEEQLEVEVNRKLREFANEQQVILANYKADLSERQEQSNLKLAGYVMSAARNERKEDLIDFVNFINEQRRDEQLNQKIRFQQLEQKIGYRKANFINDLDDSSQTNIE